MTKELSTFESWTANEKLGCLKLYKKTRGSQNAANIDVQQEILMLKFYIKVEFTLGSNYFFCRSDANFCLLLLEFTMFKKFEIWKKKHFWGMFCNDRQLIISFRMRNK